jgi:hypothetical protein
MSRFYVGLDLGQRRDHSAVALVEKLERVRPWGPPEFEAFLVRHLERMPLGTTYPQVVERVCAMVGIVGRFGACELVLDATGVGAPVVDMLRREGPSCDISSVTITGGEKETGGPGYGGGQYNVPKKDLIVSVQLALEKGELRIAQSLREADALVEELVSVRKTAREGGRERVGAERAGEHDDLVIALALACWKGRRVVKMNNLGPVRLF